MIEFVSVDRPDWATTINAPVPTSEQFRYLEREMRFEPLRRTAWSVLPASFAAIMMALYPNNKSPRSLPDNIWIASVAAYHTWHLTVFGLSYQAIHDLDGSDIFWGGNYDTLLSIQLSAVKAIFQKEGSIDG